MATACDTAALLAKIQSGVKRTTVDGTTVENQSTNDLIQALRLCRDEEAVNNPRVRAYRTNWLRSPGGIWGAGRRW